MPDEDYLSDKIDTLKSKFVFAGSIVDTAKELIDAISISPQSDPPVIYMNFSNAESKYNYGGSVAALDLSWFARYKPITDKLISGILWVLFIWRVFVLLPGIINGAPGVVGAYDEFATKNTNKKIREEIGWKKR